MVSTGGNPVKEDIYRLYQTVHVIVATPGRILDLATKNVAKLEDRAKRLFNACKAAGAKWVGASHTEVHGYKAKTGWMELYYG